MLRLIIPFAWRDNGVGLWEIGSEIFHSPVCGSRVPVEIKVLAALKIFTVCLEKCTEQLESQSCPTESRAL